MVRWKVIDMSTYPTWNYFFLRKYDDAKSCFSRQTSASASIDNFENMYRKKYGIWLDHHLLKLTKLYGAEQADLMIQQNIKNMYADEKQAAAQARKQYEFHSIPDDVRVPF